MFRNALRRTTPGHVVKIVDDNGDLLPPNTAGNVGIKYPDPFMFLEYWRNPAATADKALEEDIKNFAKNRLAAYEYPREIEFVDGLPLTATGKIIRKELRELERERKGRI